MFSGRFKFLVEQLPIWVVKILFGICSKKNLEHLVFAHNRQQTKKRFASHDSFQQGTDAKISWLHRKLVPDTQTPAAFFGQMSMVGPMVSKRETNGKADKPEKPETPRHLAFLHEGNERPNGEHVNDGFHDDLREDFFIFFSGINIHGVQNAMMPFWIRHRCSG